MRRLLTIGLAVVAGLTAAVTTSGSAYAGETSTGKLTPALTITQSNTTYQDDLMGGCGSHRANRTTSTAP